MFCKIKSFLILFCALIPVGARAVSEFTVTTTPDTTSFAFKISAAGQFEIDWGDGNPAEVITKTNTIDTTYSHTYSAPGAYDIGISGQATSYSPDSYTAAITFSADKGNENIASISGSLGAIFGTLNSGAEKQPRFFQTFYYSLNLTGNIPDNLFSGIYGAPIESMFYSTFEGCNGLTGSIPSGLFSGLSGAPAMYLFDYTFYGCSGLTGKIPAGLFDGISGPPAPFMFEYTFSECSGLTGIPDGLFGGISGPPADGMFSGTFSGCSGLTGSIPANLFGNINGSPTYNMFDYTFYGCSGLTGSIPPGLFGDLSGKSADFMFYGTFQDCSGLTGYVNADLFALPASNAYYPYSNTFFGANNMSTTCPANTYNADKPDPNWTVAVCHKCPNGTVSPANSPNIDSCVSNGAVCDDGFVLNSLGACSKLCTAGITKLNSSTGVIAPLFETAYTVPAIHVRNANGTCHADLIPGTATNAIHINYQGQVYHTMNVAE